MRFARKMGIAGHGSLTILKPGTWDFKYKGEDATWKTNLSVATGYNPNQYTPIEPGINQATGAHVFNPYLSNMVCSACTSVAIDLSNYSKIKVAYNSWVNSSPAMASVIELMAPEQKVMLPWKDTIPSGSTLTPCWLTVDPSTTSPGEIEYKIPDAVRKDKTPRIVWIKSFSVQYLPVAKLEITKITLT